MTPALCALTSTPDLSLVHDNHDVLDRFVILLYDRTSSEEYVNVARKQLFAQKGRPLDGLPPIKAV